MTGEADAPSTYSRGSSAGSKTLEQETVDTLNAAGYAAYNVTGDNYDSLESTLKTDFSAMGLGKNGSYIVVISGEDSSNSNNPNSRLGNIPEYDLIDPGVGDLPYMEYTYEGTTYKMRYVTITSVDNPEYHSGDVAELSATYASQFGINFLTTTFNLALDYLTAPIPTSAIFSLLGLNTSDGYSVGTDPISFHGTATWTRIFHSNMGC